MRKIGEKVLVKSWNFVCDIISFIVWVFNVALRPTKRFSLTVRAVCSAIATGITGAIIAKLVSGSFIISGIMYGTASIQKHLGILWASEGDWSHWMSGGRYLAFKALKEELIATDMFAQLLNSLAGKGLVLKFVQLGLIALCFASMIFLFAVLCKCLRTFGRSIKAIIKKSIIRKQHRKVQERRYNENIVNISNYQRNNRTEECAPKRVTRKNII